MSSRQAMYDRRKGRPQQIVVSLVCSCALAYFAYHAVMGRRGLEARSRLIERSQRLEPEIERLEAARARLDLDVRLLNAGDGDLIAELAIELLGFAPIDSRVIVSSSEPASSEPVSSADAARALDHPQASH
jgi:cell division protein FtsB